MSKTCHNILGLILSAVVLLFLAGALSIQNTAYAATVKPSVATFDVAQTVDTDGLYTDYKLIPVEEGNPMPEGTTNGAYYFSLSDANQNALKFSITFTKPGMYDYRLGAVTADGWLDVENALYQVSFKVTRGDNHTLNIIPTICVGSATSGLTDDCTVFLPFDISKDTVSCSCTCNCGKCTPKTNGCTCQKACNCQTAETTAAGGTTGTTASGEKTTATAKAATSATSTVKSVKAAYVNTNDPTSILMWLGTLALAAIGFLFFLILRRKSKEDEEEDDSVCV